MKIEIEHLGYTVEIKDIKNFSGCVEGVNDLKGATEIVDSNKSIMWLKMPLKYEYIPTVVHELLHVLRNILMSRGMDIQEESEHVAYISQFIMRKIMKLENKK